VILAWASLGFLEPTTRCQNYSSSVLDVTLAYFVALHGYTTVQPATLV